MSTTQIKPDLSIVITEHPNAIRSREAFAAFARADLDAVRGYLADDCTWVNGGASALAGTYRGWDEIQAMFLRLFEITGGTASNAVTSVYADDDCTVTLYDATSTVAGATRTMPCVLVNEMVDGRAKTVRMIAQDQAAADAHFAGITAQP
jgi:ketosteroid isomerase-like protein